MMANKIYIRGKLAETHAREMYIQGMSLNDIARQLGVNRGTVHAWKKKTKHKDTGVDEWDKARMQKRSYLQRLRDVFDTLLSHVEELKPDQIKSGHIKTLKEFSDLVQSWSTSEQLIKKLIQDALDEDSKEEKDGGGRDRLIREVNGLLGISSVLPTVSD